MKIIMGTPNKPSGWTSIDRRGGDHRIHLDKNTKLDMFESGSVSCIYTSHMVEHMKPEDVQNIFNESHKILRSGGILRVVAPDALMFINEYISSPENFGKNTEYGVGSGRTYYEEIQMFVHGILRLPKHLANECLKPHNLLCSEFAAYCDRPQYGHTFDKHMFDLLIDKIGDSAKANDHNVDALLTWITSHYEEGRPAGHMTAFYAEKVRRLMVGAGFDYEQTHEMSFRNSHLPEICSNPAIDLELRKTISFYVEGIKQ